MRSTVIEIEPPSKTSRSGDAATTRREHRRHKARDDFSVHVANEDLIEATGMKFEAAKKSQEQQLLGSSQESKSGKASPGSPDALQNLNLPSYVRVEMPKLS